SDDGPRVDRLYSAVAERKPTTILVCYGAVEAFDGDPGLPRWRTGLGAMLDQLAKNNGARILLMTPPLQESTSAYDPAAYHANLTKYNDVIRDIAAKRKLPLIDLAAQVKKYQTKNPDKRLTENGQQFGEAGYRVLAGLFVDALGWPRK